MAAKPKTKAKRHPGDESKSAKKGTRAEAVVEKRQKAAKARKAEELRTSHEAQGTADAWASDKHMIAAKARVKEIFERCGAEESHTILWTLHQDVAKVTTGLTPKGLTSATLKLIDCRTKAVTTRLSFTRAVGDAEAMLDTARGYLQNNYSEHVKGGTKDERRAVLDAYFADEIMNLRRAEAVIEMADLVISNIDSAAWGIKRVDDLSRSPSGSPAT